MALLGGALALMAPARSLARVAVRPPLPGPASFTTGIIDDPYFLGPPAATVDTWMGRAEGIGSSTIKIGVTWAGIAPYNLPRGFDPTNPGDSHYNWTNLDRTVRSAAAHRQSIMLTVAYAPSWAEGANRPSGELYGAWEPQPARYAQFAHAIAVRYSGHYPDPLHPGAKLPRALYFQAWNEPNLPHYLLPQWFENSSGKLVPASPGIYRGMLNAFYNAVKKVNRSNVVLAAGTGPFGDLPNQGQGRMYPVTFYQNLFCLTARLKAQKCANPPRFDVLDHHPYSASPAVKARVPGDITVPDIGKITRIVRAAQRLRHLYPVGRKQIWVGELDWSSNPENALTLARQAHYAAQSFYTLWSEGVNRVYWFSLVNPPASDSSSLDSFAGGGLFDPSGTAKPAAQAYRFPFATARLGNHQLAYWGVAPRRGKVQIQKYTGHKWRTLFTLRTNAGRIFYTRRIYTFNVSRLPIRATQGPTTVSLPYVLAKPYTFTP
jgi:hypothetical protein